jgi:hypothetical protein
VKTCVKQVTRALEFFVHPIKKLSHVCLHFTQKKYSVLDGKKKRKKVKGRQVKRCIWRHTWYGVTV